MQLFAIIYLSFSCIC